MKGSSAVCTWPGLELKLKRGKGDRGKEDNNSSQLTLYIILIHTYSYILWKAPWK